MKKVGVAIAVVVGTLAHPVNAEVPTADAAARVSLAAQVSQGLKDYAQMVQTVYQLTQLANLATVASTLLGDTVSPEMGALFNNATTAYRTTSRTYGSVMAVPANIEAELSPFQEPASGWTSLSFDEMTQRAERIRRLTAGTQIAAVAQQGEFAEHQILLQQQAARANRMADTSVSAVSATQAVAQQGRVTNMALRDISQIGSDMLAASALKDGEASAEDGLFKGRMNLDMQRMKQNLQVAYEQPKRSPLIWGR